MRMNAIVAVCGEPGKTALAIGARGQLAWKIPAEMKHFARLTKATKDKSKQNAVLMGRATYESIPAKFRPLAGRINIVLSSTMPNAEENEQLYVCRSIDEALKLLTSEELQKRIETIWNIGGRSLFNWLLVERPDFLHQLHLTRINSSQEDIAAKCDVFLDADKSNATDWTQMREIDYNAMDEEEKENYCREHTHEHYTYSFHIYERANK